MKFRSLVSYFLFLSLAAQPAWAQVYRKTPQGLKAEVAGQEVEICFYAPDIVRVVKSPEKLDRLPGSFAVIKIPEQTRLQISDKPGGVVLQSDVLQVELNLSTGQLRYADKGGKQLLVEKEQGTQFTPVTYDDNQTYLVRQEFLLDKDEAIYGLGQQQDGKMIRRNQQVELLQGNTLTCIPYMQSVKGYGVYWDNTSRTLFTDNPQVTAFDSEAGTCADYYFLYGKNADDVIGCMRDLTGQVQMNPLWTYGFWQSRERYTGQDELLDVVRKYRELKVPLDGIIQDWQYWGTDWSNWNALMFDNPKFFDPKKMVDEVHAMNAHIAVSVWPSFGDKSEVYKVFKDKNMLLDLDVWPAGSRLYDPFNPEARDIYWDYMNKNLFALGIDAWWLDATEPELFENNKTKLNQKTSAGQFRAVTNAFPIATVGGVYDHQRKVTSDKRVYIFTRSAFAGQQRYGANSWSGDIKSSWSVLHTQIAAGLNFSICGIPYWNTDIGGFASCDSFPEGLKDPAFRELFVRWTQFGAFTPMMRSHGTCTPREIYQFGEPGSWEYDALEKSIKLRYKLLPYLYSTAWNVTKKGDTFMRALFMDFPEDTRVLDIADQYMFGCSLLVAPVTSPMYVDATKRVNMETAKKEPVYLPAGAEWIDFWNGQRLQGGQTVNREAPIDLIPLYVKAGSILPMGPEVQYATEKKWDNLEIRVYPGVDGEFLLYEDENDNYNYEQGVYSTIPFYWNDKERTLVIGDREGRFPGMLNTRKFRIVLVDKGNGCGDKLSFKVNKVVNYKGKALKVKL